MKKVLIITGTLKFGGVERLIIDTAKALKTKGSYYPVVCSLLEGGELENELKNSNIEYYSLKFKNLKNIIGNLLKIRKLIKKSQPNIIHTHQFASDFYGVIGSMGLNISVVCHLHNPQMEKWSRKIIRYILSRWFIDGFIAVVDEKAELLKKSIPSIENKIFILYNAINPENFHLPADFNHLAFKKQLSIPEQGLIIGSVGRLSPEKGYDLLLLAFKEILEKAPYSFLILVGDGPEKENLINLAKKLKIDERVIFAGYQKEIIKFLTIFDIFVVSSKIESFSITSLEAMYCGLPVIITDRLSSKDILSRAAMVVPCSVEGIQDGIVKLINDEKLRKEMSEKGKLLVEKEFSIGSYISKLENIYDLILNKKI
jgi:glycosyltransferase involved in cell wall biosynthesis